MADRTLRLTATFNDAGALTGLKVLNAELGKTETAGKKGKTGLLGFGQGLTDLQSKATSFTAAAALVAVGFQKVYAQAKEGAALELAEERFDNLTESIGTTSESILTKLSAATAGMMSDAKMIAGASQIISLGLADTEEGVVDLASLIGQLGWDMNQVIMTFANNSKMRLDALGLSVEDVTNRAKALEAQGYSMDKAFDMAVIEAGQAKLALLGSAADTSVGSFERLDAWWANITDSAKRAVSEGLTPAVDAFLLLVTWTEKLNATRITHFENAGTEYQQYVAETVKVKLANGELTQSEAELVLQSAETGDAVEVLRSRFDPLGQSTGVVTEAMYAASLAGGDLSVTEEKLETAAINAALAEDVQVTTLFELVQAYGQAGITTDSYTEAQEAAKEATEQNAQAMSDLALFMQGPLGAEYDAFTEKNTELVTKADELRATIAELGGTEWMTPEQATQIATLQAQLNSVTGDILALDESIQGGELKNNQEYEATQNLEALREKAWELEQQIIALGGKPFVTTANMGDMEAAREELAKTNEAIAANAAAHDDATRRIVLDLATQRAAVDGFSAAEVTLLEDLATKWGLIDESTVAAVATIDTALTDLANGQSITEVEAQIMGIDEALVLTNENMAEKGVGAMTDYELKMLELGEPLVTTAEKVGTLADTTQTLADKLNAVNGNFNANINVNVTGDPIPNLGNTSTAPGGPVLPEAKARGGPVSANELYMVGEEGPELFMSGQAGRIIPAGQTRDMMREAFGAFEGGGGGVHIGQLIIQQLPGENAEALARRVVQIIQQRNR